MNSSDSGIDPQSQFKKLAAETLESLAQIRVAEGAWIDSESESEARETQVFKIAECLLVFYRAAFAYSDFTVSELTSDFLLKDSKSVLSILDRDGFFPSPYSPIIRERGDAPDQYTDMAAFSLEYCAAIWEYWSHADHRSQPLLTAARKVARRALALLVKPSNRVTDQNGCRWAGTTEHSRTKKSRSRKDYFTSTYFTSVVIRALSRVVDHPVLHLDDARKSEIRELVSKAGAWIASRYQGSLLMGNEENTDGNLLHTTWGLIALIETVRYQTVSARDLVPAIATGYLDALSKRVSSGQLNISQEYLPILAKDFDSLVYYEDRSGLAGVLLALTSLRLSPDCEQIITSARYLSLFEQTMNTIYSLRDPINRLWNRQSLILSAHVHFIEAFLLLAKYPPRARKPLHVSAQMLRAAVKQALTDDSVITAVQTQVYERLSKLADTEASLTIIQQDFERASETALRRRPEPSTPSVRSRGAQNPTRFGRAHWSS